MFPMYTARLGEYRIYLFFILLAVSRSQQPANERLYHCLQTGLCVYEIDDPALR